MNTLDSFKATLTDPEPSVRLTPLQALWWEAKGEWHKAHDLLQDDNSPAGSWVHAYLHRKEPDPANAAYWYRRAGQPVAAGSFEEEWDAIATALLNTEPA
ncbi:MAG: hypothetical protein SFU56_00145 [Capsulimonadales bacterium]|nr:hypothetical protein [Capsulimonadales bacterium]